MFEFVFEIARFVTGWHGDGSQLRLSSAEIMNLEDLEWVVEDGVLGYRYTG